MKTWRFLKPKGGKEIPFLVMVSFLSTFAISRAFLYIFPNFFLQVKTVHVHHFAYGIFLLAIIGYILLTQPRSPSTRLKISVFYGIALGMAFDEFAMWIQLEDSYWDRTNFDAVVTLSLLLANIVYFDDFWRKWGYRLKSFFIRLVS
jgi:hypothetical protein